jgi:hypothetical protein
MGHVAHQVARLEIDALEFTSAHVQHDRRSTVVGGQKDEAIALQVVGFVVAEGLPGPAPGARVKATHLGFRPDVAEPGDYDVGIEHRRANIADVLRATGKRLTRHWHGSRCKCNQDKRHHHDPMLAHGIQFACMH